MVGAVRLAGRRSTTTWTPTGQTGWFPADRSETAKGSTVRDLKEFFHVYDWSVYPAEVSDAALRYRQIAIDLAQTLLDWVEANTPDEVTDGLSMPLSSMMTGSTRITAPRAPIPAAPRPRSPTARCVPLRTRTSTC